MSYAIVVTEPARKQLRLLPPDVQPRLLKKLDNWIGPLRDARAVGVPRMMNGDEVWQYVIGNYRVSCVVDERNKKITVTAIHLILVR
jgi:mRNA-degrading endonuclease RelE of RelBE toxin-antitoxin system